MRNAAAKVFLLLQFVFWFSPGAQAQSSDDAQIKTYFWSEPYADLVEKAFAAISPEELPPCTDNVRVGTVIPQHPIFLGGDGAPIKGAWIHRFRDRGCGREVIITISFSAGQDGKVHFSDIKTSPPQQERDLDPNKLRIAMRTPSYAERARQIWGNQPMAARPLAGDLWIMGVVDLPDAIRVLKPDDIKGIGLNPEQALAAAQMNTRYELKRPITHLQQAAASSHDIIGLTGDPYISSLLALDDLWPDVAKAMDGHLLAMAPSHDVLLVVNDEDDTALTDLQRAGHEVFKTTSTPLTETVFRWTDKGWTTLAP